MGFTSPLSLQLLAEQTISDNRISWVASSLVLGQISGSFFGSIAPNKIGRKKVCLTCASFSLLSWGLIAASQYDWMILLGRFLTGFSNSLPVPGAVMYVSEVTEIRLKGSALNTTTVASGLGIALGLLIGTNLHWRYASVVPMATALLVLGTLSYCYDSPVYLLMRDKDPRDVLLWYRESAGGNYQENVDRELKELRDSTATSDHSLRSSLKKLFSGENCKAFIILFVIFTLYPITGVYSIVFFAIDLFSRLGLVSAVVVSVISALLRVLGTCFSSVLLFKFGRRKIMVFSTATCALLNGLIGGLIILRDKVSNETLVSWVLTVLIMVIMFCVGISMVGFPWILMGKCNCIPSVLSYLLLRYSGMVQSRPQAAGQHGPHLLPVPHDLHRGPDHNAHRQLRRQHRPLHLLLHHLHHKDRLYDGLRAGDSWEDLRGCQEGRRRNNKTRRFYFYIDTLLHFQLVVLIIFFSFHFHFHSFRN